MLYLLSKFLALAIALGYVIAFIHAKGDLTIEVLMTVGVLLFPLALIWFPEAIGSFTGYVGRGGDIDTETPPILVSLAGWFFLVGLPILFHFLWWPSARTGFETAGGIFSGTTDERRRTTADGRRQEQRRIIIHRFRRWRRLDDVLLICVICGCLAVPKSPLKTLPAVSAVSANSAVHSL